MKRISLLFLFSLTVFYGRSADYSDSLITVTGRVIDTSAIVGFYNLVVVNKTLGKGNFGNYDGTFTITVRKKADIAISCTGYHTTFISFRDSVYKRNYDITIYLKALQFTGREVIVTKEKTLEELKEERAALAKREVPEVTMENAISSPITALYVTFSKREKTKRKIAELEYMDRQEDIIREILRIYVDNDIIDLSDEEFDEFIRFLNLHEDFLRTASDYELLVYIKEKYAHFRKIKEGY